jgi:hypothetical protein
VRAGGDGRALGIELHRVANTPGFSRYYGELLELTKLNAGLVDSERTPAQDGKGPTLRDFDDVLRYAGL